MLARNLKPQKSYRQIIGSLVLVIILLVALFLALGSALDHSIDNQSVMLCESAKVSGNVDYLEKCETYYATGSVEYLR